MVLKGFLAVFLAAWLCALGMGTDTEEFFPEIKGDLTGLTWYHAANSVDKLTSALNGDYMMIEADILMGTKIANKTEKLHPVMAHPPDTASDLSFDEFLKKVIKANRHGKKKGIKLDFKSMGAVEPVMKQLNKKKNDINFPVWINADIWEGPINASLRGVKPLDAEQFIKTVTEYSAALRPTLSLGWTTRFGDEGKDPKSLITDAKYTREDVADVLHFLDNSQIDASVQDVTFPVRAGIAVQSIDALMTLLTKAGPRATLTLWSKKTDPVDQEKIKQMITIIGRNKIYTDLPFDLDDKPKSGRIIVTDSSSSASTEPSSVPSSSKNPEKTKGRRRNPASWTDTADKAEKKFDPRNKSNATTDEHVNASPPHSSSLSIVFSSILMTSIALFFL